MKRKRGVLFIAFLFALLTLVHVAWQLSGFRGFVNNTVVTAVYTVYLGAVMIYLSVATRLVGDTKELAVKALGAIRGRPA